MSHVLGLNAVSFLAEKVPAALAEVGLLQAGEFADLPWDEASPHVPLADVLRVHDWPYVRKLQVGLATER